MNAQIEYHSPAPRIRRARRGLSIVLIVLVLVLLVGFVSFAVDIGRVRLAKAELQTAADAAALAGASGLELGSDNLDLAIDRAVDAAAFNDNIDVDPTNGQRRPGSVELIPDEDVEFGIWRESTRTFEIIEETGGGIDERRHANAIRTFARRCTSFEKEYADGGASTITRNTGLPLIFAPILPDGPLKGEIQTRAIARIREGRTGYGFIGLDWVQFSGTTRADSYDANTETYPGLAGPNQQGSVSSNGDITLHGDSVIEGDARSGPDGEVSLNGTADVTGVIFPTEHLLVEGKDYIIPTFAPQTSSPNTQYKGSPSTISGMKLYRQRFQLNGDHVTIDNTAGPVTIWVRGDYSQSGNSTLEILSPDPKNPVTFYINGDLSITGGSITSPPGSRPALLTFNLTNPGTDAAISGMSTLSAHLNAPLSDVTITGSGSFALFGSVVGKTLDVKGNTQLHHDQTSYNENKRFRTHLVR